MSAPLPRELTADRSRVYDDTGVLAYVIPEPRVARDTRAIAAEMVKRWNAHSALVDAVKDARAFFAEEVVLASSDEYVNQMDEALKLAGETEMTS